MNKVTVYTFLFLFITDEHIITEYQVNQMAPLLFTRTTRYQGYFLQWTAEPIGYWPRGPVDFTLEYASKFIQQCWDFRLIQWIHGSSAKVTHFQWTIRFMLPSFGWGRGWHTQQNNLDKCTVGLVCNKVDGNLIPFLHTICSKSVTHNWDVLYLKWPLRWIHATSLSNCSPFKWFSAAV